MNVAHIRQAVEHLKQGRTVVIPTETVYGLGADASNPEAVRRIFAIKGRPPGHPLIVHIEKIDCLESWAKTIPPVAVRLAERFWPGPLTLVLPRRREVLPEVTGGQETVALRVPSHPVITALLRAFGGGIAAPSANRFGRLSPTSARDVYEEFKDAAGMILEGGPCSFGLESTILGFQDGHPVLLRPGALSTGTLEEFLGVRILRSAAGADSPRVPGSSLSHYQPDTPLELLPGEDLVRRSLSLSAQGRKVGILYRRAEEERFHGDGLTPVPMPREAEAYGQALYAVLHFFDRAGVDRILVEFPPQTGEWEAVNDRLGRAALRQAGQETPDPSDGVNQRP
ncbi:YrdC/Sua5 family protein [Leptospirillum ferriphilum]|jgi:L-threonylcarbamoyladenylate synthase|uniref:Threonylcarbamoyl-AMP synthase n=3 Tax=Leptospirillum TaxID=179 RepID=A0A094YJ51_9BACT|nr:MULTISPECIES: L-threonylcarbamoyladenylate synthase [Leptospirillum]EAY56876.1 MAG: SUA5/yciO/yrdC family [Leptospirillum rubarum]EDZ38150.1 MAG: SUA5/yciO/yrdC family [Leptospirillum sp. Group II '5-way CG']EIJ76797.1 MAG: SUA5/yciO/yrdC family [Leptospirillum sp. Group II 'C75']AFS54014.1 Sua5/YciO/YrdC/YwlC family protein [Leptospirillum ferriphilum ML-04]AKS23933.1 translation factor Sua5 [Leptospirillum sp. Group II 'CF-1']